jgi:nitroimidazol reductase NimA-like FMN-containing flavoprotein (pyridoxamine 5'-phosphate oxidase superfamily)
MSGDDAGLFVEHLGDDECWRLLESTSVGRIGVLVDSAPEVYPMNYAVMGRSLLFRTDEGNKLRGLERSPSVCFEIDDMDADRHTGWSVLVKGTAIELTDPGDIDRARSLPLELWSIGNKSHWFTIEPTEATGRRIERIPPGDAVGGSRDR